MAKNNNENDTENENQLTSDELSAVCGGMDLRGFRMSTNVEDRRGQASQYRTSRDGNYTIGPSGEYMNKYSYDELYPQNYEQNKDGQWVDRKTGEAAPPDEKATQGPPTPEFSKALEELSEMTRNPQVHELPPPAEPTKYHRGEFVPAFDGDEPRTGSPPEDLFPMRQ